MAPFQTALITGASSGLGAEIALQLGRGGTRVVLAARRAERLAALVERIRAAGGRADAVPLDVRDPAAVAEAVRDWDERTGGFDLVLANAGVGHTDPFPVWSWEGLEQVLAVNVSGAAATLAAALPLMRVRGRGTLAGMSSLAGARGMPASGAYSASKSALSTLLESLQIDLFGTGLRVVDIRPGFVRTPMTDRNDTVMPFLWEVERAAATCIRGLERGRPVVAFPWQMVWLLRLGVRPMPRALWRWVCGRLAREPVGPH